MHDENSLMMLGLRGRRSSLRKKGQLKSSAERRDTFAAAMQQFEELLHAAKIVSSATRPLPLYYALNQAGRAIGAVHAAVPWELRGHGLKVSLGTHKINDVTVRPDGGDDSS
jgi:hypothetical protein